VRAAELLVDRGQVSDALALFRDAGEWDAMRSLIRANALDWARQGRAQALSDWIEALPSSMRERDPWLEYWVGRAWIFVQPQRGRPALERAFEAFRAAGDLRGQAFALNTIVTGYYYEWANFARSIAGCPSSSACWATGGPPISIAKASSVRALPT
jgi:ATP/maltotriose-dependent transcriptional regulator MalT